MRKNENRILNQDLVIPKETQRKIEAAYDIVRARNRAAQDGRKPTALPAIPLRSIMS